MNITVSDEIRHICPLFVGASVEATVANSPHSAALWDDMTALAESCRHEYTAESLKLQPAIAATRQVYKACGKDPSRYRPSAEALIRRILQGKALYRIDTLVDLVNLASITTGYSIGGFDADKIAGDALTLGIGREGEPYEGIGRGPINIAHLPVYRDAIGGIGTPTSDHERTKMTLATSRVLILVNGYDGSRHRTMECAQLLRELLEKYAQGCDIRTSTYG